ncbi:MAG: hypothetical protein GDA42_07975 [Ekhidna sp.]|nr:hypothetical protein [Ekhidna sp.]MBC6410380.1 hypothetical protein [Ekhidna sp.]
MLFDLDKKNQMKERHPFKLFISENSTRVICNSNKIAYEGGVLNCITWNTRELIIKIDRILDLNEKNLMMSWISDKIVYAISEEEFWMGSLKTG